MKFRKFRQKVAGWICPELLGEWRQLGTKAKNFEHQWAEDQALIKVLDAKAGALADHAKRLEAQIAKQRSELIGARATISQAKAVFNRYGSESRFQLPEVKQPQLPEIGSKSVVNTNVVPLTQSLKT